MVELCEVLRGSSDRAANGATMAAEQWPSLSGIDEHIAQLEFENSLLADQSMFSSIGLDVALISTDSLDMEQLRQRCETNKNDYKIAFEDSGQWTTSGFGTGASPSGNGTTTCLDEADLSSDDHGDLPNGNLTTWGRIRCTEPFDAHTKSMPSHQAVKLRPVQPSARNRPTSLVANFMGRQSSSSQTSEAENQQHVDLNKNEIPGDQTPGTSQIVEPDPTHDRWQHAHRQPATCGPPRRTFSDLDQSSQMDLKFLKLPYNLPTFCRASAPLDELLVEAQNAGHALPTPHRLEELRSQLLMISEPFGSRHVRPSASSPALGVGAFTEPDSGFSQSTSSGPVHIEDWPSLSVLLPKNVVETCYFFKSHTNLLGGHSRDNSVDKKMRTPWLQSTQSEAFQRPSSSSSSAVRPKLSKSSSTTLKHNRHVKLNAAELANIGLPSYDVKRRLVEKAVEGVAKILRGESAKALFRSLEQLIADGLMEGHSPWEMVVAVTSPGKATSWVYDLVQQLRTNEKSSNSRLYKFFDQLLSSHSLDGWLSYVVLKERVLCDMYEEDAFLLRAPTAYRSLFWRLIESLELLSVLSRCHLAPRGGQHDYDASRLPSDSRVPKSSSVPARLSSKAWCAEAAAAQSRAWSSDRDASHSVYLLDSVLSRPATRIPATRQPLSLTSSPVRSRSLLARARADLAEQGLPLAKGEAVRVLAVRGPLAQCSRLEPCSGPRQSVAVPTKYLQL